MKKRKGLISKRLKRRISSELLAKYGRKGGKTTLANNGPEFFAAISKKRRHFGGGRPRKKQNA